MFGRNNFEANITKSNPCKIVAVRQKKHILIAVGACVCVFMRTHTCEIVKREKIRRLDKQCKKEGKMQC